MGEHPSFQGKTVRQAIETHPAGGSTCVPQTTGGSIWDPERDCNYYSSARYRETFEVEAPKSENRSNATFVKVVSFNPFDSIATAEEFVQDALNGTSHVM